MKIPSTSRPQRGFTLIELLVVIAIIAVLAAAGFAVGSSALDRARKLASQNTATGIDQAVNAFYSEYGGFPVTEATSLPVNTGTPDGRGFLNALLGNDNTLNPRGISFLSAKEGTPRGADGGTDGIIYDPGTDSVVGLFDSWGNGFTVEMDIDFQGYLTFTPEGIADASAVRLNNRRAAVYSPGVRGADDATQRTMVKTW